jgi:hypothetical protein
MERIRPHVKVGSSDDDAVRRGNSRFPGAAQHEVPVPNQRCHSASKTRVNALMAPLRYALHRVRDTR